jgi:hypothetical protein
MKTTKICTTCGEEKSHNNFNKRSSAKDGMSSSCTVCHHIRSKSWYNRNKTKVLERTKIDGKAIQQKVREYKEAQGCRFCNEGYYKCLQFHHIDPSQKDFVLSSARQKGSWTQVLSEIAKCIVVCGNCHVKIHDGLLSPPVSVLGLLGHKKLR